MTRLSVALVVGSALGAGPLGRPAGALNALMLAAHDGRA